MPGVGVGSEPQVLQGNKSGGKDKGMNLGYNLEYKLWYPPFTDCVTVLRIVSYLL